MWLELLAAALVATIAMGPLLWRTRSWRTRGGLVFLLLVAIVGGAAIKSRAGIRRASYGQLATKLPREARPGYVRSETCRSCHPDEYASWHRSYHRTMTQPARPEAVRGAFTNVTLYLNGEEYRLNSRGGEFWAEMIDPEWTLGRAFQQQAFEKGQAPAPEPVGWAPRRNLRITMTTGSHHMQAYWIAGKDGNVQLGLPFTYLFEDQRWVPRNDVFLLPPDTPQLHQIWNANCITCHATAGRPGQDAQTLEFDSTVGELGIACESCHGPAADHIRQNSSPVRRYALRRDRKPDATILNPARLSARKASEVCSQCHATRYYADQREWLQHGFSYRPGEPFDEIRPLPQPAALGRERELGLRKREDPDTIHGTFWKDGMVRVSGREYNGLVESACFQKGGLSCLSCHSMHEMASPEDQLKPRMEGSAACTGCHSKIGRNLSAHTHHAPDSSASDCYNCHMPYTTYGLLKAIRSHQISSPNVAATIASGRPNACNLCHLDKTLAWTATNLTAWFGQAPAALDPDFETLPASVVWILRGDAGQRVIAAWHMGWGPATNAAGNSWLAPFLGEALNDPYSVVRYVAQRSLKRLPGFSDFQYDFIGSPAARARSAAQAMHVFRGEIKRRGGARPPVWITPQDYARLMDHRDSHPMELLE